MTAKSRIPTILLTALISAGTAGSQQPYEEEPTGSMQIRIDLWKQMTAYADGLPEAVRLSDAAAYSRTVETLRKRYQTQIGYPPPGFQQDGKARMEKAGEDETATYYRCYIPVTSSMEAYGLYIVPKKARLPAPLVISQHGGGGYPELATFQGGANYHDMVRGAAAQGYVVYAPHLVMYPYGDRDRGTPIPEDVRQVLDEALLFKGTSLGAVETCKISRALDVLLKRPEVDPNRVAMVGLSMGGMQTVMTTSLETRIKVAVSSGSPSLETVHLICPRPFQIQMGKEDKLIGVGGRTGDRLKASAERAARLYRKLGCEERFEFRMFDGGHEFNGALAWEFLKKHL
jgi:dienelactone hydrolase